MKYIILLVLTLSVVPGAIAQEEYLYEELIYVFSIDVSSAVPAAEECAVGLAGIRKRLHITGIDPTNGTAARFKIDSVETSASEGVVTNMANEEIGDILICIDSTTYPIEANRLPVYLEISVSGTKFRVEGGGLHPNFPDRLPGGYTQYSPPGYPTADTMLINVNGTVLPSIPGKRGGSYMASSLRAPTSSGGFNAGSNVIAVLRVVLPVSS